MRVFEAWGGKSGLKIEGFGVSRSLLSAGKRRTGYPWRFARALRKECCRLLQGITLDPRSRYWLSPGVLGSASGFMVDWG